MARTEAYFYYCLLRLGRQRSEEVPPPPSPPDAPFFVELAVVAWGYGTATYVYVGHTGLLARYIQRVFETLMEELRLSPTRLPVAGETHYSLPGALTYWID